MTIYRGFDIKPETDGTYSIHSMGSYPPCSERFQTEDKAMDKIDAIRRSYHNMGMSR